MSLMDEVNHVVKVDKEEPGDSNDGKWKAMFLGIITIIIIAAVGGGTYLLGTKKTPTSTSAPEENSETLGASEEDQQTPEPSFEGTTMPSISPSPTVVASLTPTPKATIKAIMNPNLKVEGKSMIVITPTPSP